MQKLNLISMHFKEQQNSFKSFSEGEFQGFLRLTGSRLPKLRLGMNLWTSILHFVSSGEPHPVEVCTGLFADY